MEENEKEDRDSLVKLGNPEENEIENPNYNFLPPSKNKKYLILF